ncbi:MAG: SRPBCC family protein, partial [Chloroflexota bacterium]
PPAPVPAQAIANIRAPFRQATLLPAMAYHDEAVYAWEREEIFFRDWIAVGRAEEIPEAGSFMLRDLFGENVILVRGRDDVIRAFYNVCRHRGTAVEERECGKAVRFQCPYHAWIYDLDGRLVRAKHTEDLEDFSFETFGLRPVHAATWQGFVFLNLSDGEVAPLEAQLGDLVDHLARFDFSTLRSAKRIDYDVAANWKFIAENYSECYHCPGVHPQLNKLTPYDLGGDFDPDGAWQGGWMELVEHADTMSLGDDGIGGGGHGSTNGRPPMRGITPLDERRIFYYVLWPMAFLSIHPD